MRYKRDTRKKRFIAALTENGTVYHAAQAAGVSRQTVYRWREDDLKFADLWDEAIENAVDAVENAVYQKALSGDTIAAIFYLKAQRPKFRDRLNINVEQVQSDIDEMMERMRANPVLLARTIPALKD
jgi:20S proteasome alpha/beta subunit